MEPAVAFGIGDQTTTLLVVLAVLGVIFAARLREIVVVDEVMARVVGRVDIDELHLAGVGFLQDLERIKVVALDVEVLSRVPILGLAWLGDHRLADRAARLGLSLALAWPSELVSFALAFGHVTQKIAERLEVNGALELAIDILYFGHDLREQLTKFVYILDSAIRRA